MARMLQKSDNAVRAVAETRVHAQYSEHEGHLPEHERQGTAQFIFQESATEKEQHMRPPAKRAKSEKGGAGERHTE